MWYITYTIGSPCMHACKKVVMWKSSRGLGMYQRCVGNQVLTFNRQLDRPKQNEGFVYHDPTPHLQIHSTHVRDKIWLHDPNKLTCNFLLTGGKNYWIKYVDLGLSDLAWAMGASKWGKRHLLQFSEEELNKKRVDQNGYRTSWS